MPCFSIIYKIYFVHTYAKSRIYIWQKISNICIFSLLYFTQCHFHLLQFYCKWQNIILHGQTELHCVYIWHFLYLFLYWQTLKLIPQVDYYRCCYNKYDCANIVWCADIFFEHILTRMNAESCSSYNFSVYRSFHADFHSGWTNLHSEHLCVFPFPTPPPTHTRILSYLFS